MKVHVKPIHEWIETVWYTVRGGYFNYYGRQSKCANRNGADRTSIYNDLSLRVVLVKAERSDSLKVKRE